MIFRSTLPCEDVRVLQLKVVSPDCQFFGCFTSLDFVNLTFGLEAALLQFPLDCGGQVRAGSVSSQRLKICTFRPSSRLNEPSRTGPHEFRSHSCCSQCTLTVILGLPVSWLLLPLYRPATFRQFSCWEMTLDCRYRPSSWWMSYLLSSLPLSIFLHYRSLLEFRGCWLLRWSFGTQLLGW